MLGRHGQQDLFERIRVIIDKSQHTTEPIHEMIEEAPVDLGFNAIDQEGQVARNSCKGLVAGRWRVWEWSVT